MSPLDEADAADRIASAKLGMAEDFGWALGISWALLAYLKWDSWLLALAVAVGVYVAMTYPYRRAGKKAADYHHALRYPSQDPS